MEKQFLLVVFMCIFIIAKSVNSQIEETLTIEFECENGVPFGWENTGTDYKCAEEIGELPPYKPGEFEDLPGNGIWYWNGNENPAPTISFATIENAYKEYMHINISFRYYAFGNVDTLQIEVKPIKCPELRQCGPTYLPPSSISKDWLVVEYAIETNELPIEIIGTLKTGQWMLLDAINIKVVKEDLTTVMTSPSSSSFPTTQFTITDADTSMVTTTESMFTTTNNPSSSVDTTLTQEYSTVTESTTMTQEYSTQSTTLTQKYSTETDSTTFTQEYSTETESTTMTQEYSSETDSTRVTQEYSAETESTTLTQEYSSETDSTTFTQEYSTETESTTMTQEYSSETDSTTVTQEYSAETESTTLTQEYSTETSNPDPEVTTTYPTTTLESDTEGSSITSFYSTSAYPESSTSYTSIEATNNFWYFAFLIAIAMLGITWIGSLICILYLLAAKNQKRKPKHTKNFESTENNFEFSNIVSPFHDQKNVISKITHKNETVRPVHLNRFSIPRAQTKQSFAVLPNR